MPTATNLTVKKADLTTDVTYTLKTASGGDKSPAIWRADASTGNPGQKPELRVSSRSNGENTARRVDATFTFPVVVTDSTTTLTSVASRCNMSISAVVPLDVPETLAEEFATQAAGLLYSTLLRQTVKTGYAPT